MMPERLSRRAALARGLQLGGSMMAMATAPAAARLEGDIVDEAAAQGWRPGFAAVNELPIDDVDARPTPEYFPLLANLFARNRIESGEIRTWREFGTCLAEMWRGVLGTGRPISTPRRFWRLMEIDGLELDAPLRPSRAQPRR